MLLVIDIGNSNVVGGIWNKKKWRHHLRFETHPVDKERYRKELSPSGIKNTAIDCIISSVVPAATQPVVDVLSGLYACAPMILDAAFDLGITIKTDRPEKVGTDLIADAVGAYHLIQDSCIVVDFGTATTLMRVEKPGVLQGVAICAGLNSSKETLAGKAAQLFDVPLQPPPSVLGKNTTHSMQSGLVLGHLAMVEGLIERIKHEFGKAKVIATGGFAEMLAQHTGIFDRVVPTLTLEGLRIIAERQMAGGNRQRPNGR